MREKRRRNLKQLSKSKSDEPTRGVHRRSRGINDPVSIFSVSNFHLLRPDLCVCACAYTNKLNQQKMVLASLIRESVHGRKKNELNNEIVQAEPIV